MTDNVKFLLVDAQVLPEVFTKVVQAKCILPREKPKVLRRRRRWQAFPEAHFYKYKDSVYLYDERMNENIVTFYLTLEDRPGVLSSLLGELYQAGSNIITVNQNIPVDGVAWFPSPCARAAQACPDQKFWKNWSVDGIVEAKAI